MASKSQQTATATPTPSRDTEGPAQGDINFDAFEGLMGELSAAEPDPEVCQRLFDDLGTQGQELVLKDATMGPKMRAVLEGGANDDWSWWDVVEAGTDLAAGAVETGVDVLQGEVDPLEAARDAAGTAADVARTAVDAGIEAASNALGDHWDPMNHPVLERLAELPGEAVDTGQAVWDAARDAAGFEEEEEEETTEEVLEEEVVPTPDFGPRVVTRPGERMYETSTLTGRVTIQEIEPVEVVETVRVSAKDDRFGKRVEDRYHIQSTDEASTTIDHWVKFGALSTDAELNDEFGADDLIPLDQVSRDEYAVARIWNEKGGFIDAQRGSLPRSIAVAVMKVESGGLGNSGAGDMVIRFENHKFYRSGEGISKTWGKDNLETFDNHFRPRRGAENHEFNADGADSGGEWVPFHGSQSMEWQALQLAIDISGDAEAAYCAISMGAGQVMGFNALKLGYDSAADMFEQFNGDAEANVGGVFSFIEANPDAKAALEREDYEAFARQYNGDGDWVATYRDWLSQAAEAFESLEKKFLSGEEEQA